MLHSIAPAKINLYLHVTGRRSDGYHTLDSLVVFTDIGDFMSIEPSSSFVFELDGPKAADLAGTQESGNLAVRAVKSLAKELGRPLNVKLRLTKNLPVASGIGGGSSDAAAALRLLAEQWGVPKTASSLTRIASDLGKDVPCCLEAKTCYFNGAGEIFDEGPALPHTDIVLVNPGKALSTPSVFSAYAESGNGRFSEADRLDKVPRTGAELAGLLHSRKNDLTSAACKLLPEIRAVLDAISATEGCQLARMSGSGATCFGIYPNRSLAKKAAARILGQNPGWWVVPGHFPCKRI